MMRHYISLFALLMGTAPAAAVTPAELKPGLVGTYSDSAPARSISRVEPTVGLALAAGETPHPQLAQGARCQWKGYVNIVRPGAYFFSATVQGGTLEVRIAAKPVLTAMGQTEAKLATGAEAALAGGVQPFEAVFVREGKNPSRVELMWRGPGFVTEPMSNQFLGHLPADQPASYAADARREHGRYRFEEMACIRCHRPDPADPMAKGLVDRPAPILTDIGKRAFPGWLDAWLANPAKLRPNTTMPGLFADTPAGAAERYAVIRYLVNLGGSPALEAVKPPLLSGEYRQSMERGKVLFTVTGCAACHQPAEFKKPARNDEEDDERSPLQPEDYAYSAGSPAGPVSRYEIGKIGSKTRPDLLAAYLQNPLKFSPGGRMPHMVLEAKEATDLARYLCRLTDEHIPSALPEGAHKPATIAAQVHAAYGSSPEAIARFDKDKADAQWVELGKMLMVTKGCVNCHQVEAGGKPIAATARYPSLAEIRKQGNGTGCLAETPAAGKVPAYHFGPNEHADVAAFLKDGLDGAGSPAPGHAARVALKRFNCLNCHARDGEGGMPAELAAQTQLLVRSENADDVRPPLLTGVGHKSRTAWLKAVLTQAGRARPWMQLRMPQYGEPNVGFLPTAIAALEGTVPDDTVHHVELTPARVAAGRLIVGKGGLGCISCHDISGIPNTGTRGPDLSTIDQRVRYDWYTRWLHQPLRLAPGTRMPQVFVDGKSLLTTSLNGDADAQAAAMWSYLSLGPGLPLPDGLEPPRGLVILVKDRPEILRTFMTDAGNRAIAVGYPGGVSIAFSADQCRTAYAWAGNFLDASPVWNNRGGSPAKLLGPTFWAAPPGHPWGLTVNPNLPPDFLGRANNPAFGMPLPQEPPRIYSGPMAVGFDGYGLDPAGQPTFRYHLTEGKDAELKIAETPIPTPTTVGPGFRRKFEADVPGGYRAWYLAGSASNAPRVIDAAGAPIALDLKAADPSVTAAGSRLLLPDGGKLTVMEAGDVPAGTIWRFTPRPGGWLAVLRLPETKSGQKFTFSLSLWSLQKDDPGLLKGLN